MDKSVVTILSTNYAGSHFLSLLIGSHVNCACVGEIHHLRKYGTNRDNLCHICNCESNCPVASIEGTDQADIYEKLFKNFSEVDPNVSFLIDNSKKVRWAKNFVNKNDFNRKYIHLIRDPRALIRRWQMNNDTPQKKRRVWRSMLKKSIKSFQNLALCEEDMLYVNKWLYQNQEITKFIKRNNLDCYVLSYHDLATNTAGALSDIMSWIGLEYNPSQLNYWEFEHHSSIKKKYMNKKQGKNHIDLRWKEYHSPELIDAINSMRKVNNYLEDHQLKLTETGISKIDEY